MLCATLSLIVSITSFLYYFYHVYYNIVALNPILFEMEWKKENVYEITRRYDGKRKKTKYKSFFFCAQNICLDNH